MEERGPRERESMCGRSGWPVPSVVGAASQHLTCLTVRCLPSPPASKSTTPDHHHVRRPSKSTPCPTLAELLIALSAHRARQLAATRVILDMAMFISVVGVPMCSIPYSECPSSYHTHWNVDRDGTGTGRFRGRRP
ncbi:hypothetical protein BC827DRAFT_248464 [Russula dissimulans]|nr:hypothetical protein BC827DRAFT_248464 [Russula dissimulans]